VKGSVDIFAVTFIS